MMLYLLLLLGSLLFGLILIAIGLVVLLKLKNKIAGILSITVGLAFALCPFAIFLALIPVRVQGG